MASEAKLLVDFQDAREQEQWYAVNDGVMGGVSSGGFAVGESTGVFAGEVSLENNGGFASVRRRPRDYGLSGMQAIRLRALGDGKTYRFRIKTDETFDGVFYQTHFKTEKDAWEEHVLPFAEFYASFRGRRVEAPPLDPVQIRQIGFLIAEKQTGPFRLEIDWIKAE
ncbi:MAG: CIA30 family protein [Candidatus Eisenbacteria bacterium]|nr:CIA30 family protein [Candidatus Eisenbacteria bacterium]